MDYQENNDALEKAVAEQVSVCQNLLQEVKKKLWGRKTWVCGS